MTADSVREEPHSHLSGFSVSDLKGVGRVTSEKLAAKGIQTVMDVLLRLPIRYEDRSQIHFIADTQSEQSTHIQGHIVSARVIFAKRRQLLCQVDDETGRITLRFFHFNAAQQQALNQAGLPIRVFGQVRKGRQGKEMIHPSYQLGQQALEPIANQESYTPIYRSVDGIKSSLWEKLSQQACALLRSNPSLLPDTIPARFRGELRLPLLTDAFLYVHAPTREISLEQLHERSHPMFKRLALEELLAHHFALASPPDDQIVGQAPAFKPRDRLGLGSQLLQALPFELTQAQKKSVQEIAGDCESTKPMMRLLQGDVGSGKTLVAAMAACLALDNGYQVAVMAPTEILAYQHMRSFKRWLEPLGVKVVCLVGSLKAAEKRDVLADISSGEGGVVIGTHAIFQDQVIFSKLGLLVIDEQHRFGVTQRLALRNKACDNQAPHQLVMTATPIPRSLAMAVYSHCDHTIIDELPPGRQPIQTTVLPQSRRELVMQRLISRLKTGERVYWVCPLIEESESMPLQTIEATFEELRAALKGYSVAMLHGRLSPVEKEKAMNRFASGDVQVLLATTVVEVGVDVPEATIIVIDNAERFGLAQLHQLRGRVGRGQMASHCLLLHGLRVGKAGQERLEVMRRCQDGFAVAQADLQQRGPGQLLGQRQAGYFEFELADWERDSDLLMVVDQLKGEISVCDSPTWSYLARKWTRCDSDWLNG